MDFKSDVIAQVRPLLKDNEFTGFTNGTLFINASEATARKAFSQLFVNVSTMIQITKVYGNAEGGEYAIDFTAA